MQRGVQRFASSSGMGRFQRAHAAVAVMVGGRPLSTTCVHLCKEASSAASPVDLFFEMMGDDAAADKQPSKTFANIQPSSVAAPPTSDLAAAFGMPDLVQAVHAGGLPNASALAAYVAPHVADPQERFHISDPTADGMMLFDVMGEDNTTAADKGGSTTTLAAQYAKRGAQVIWERMTPAAPSDKAPQWFSNLCRDLYFRTSNGEGVAPTDASDPAPQGGASGDAASGVEVDPFLWIDFHLLSDASEYAVGPYVFPEAVTKWYSDEDKAQLCLGDVAKEYVCFASGYCFPERHQLPTSLGTVPIRLLLDPSKQEPTVYVQLSEDFPPCMWLPVKADAAAVRRVVSEFAAAAASHRHAHHDTFTQRWQHAQRTLHRQRMGTEDGDILRMVAHQARDIPYGGGTSVREFPNRQEFFLGEYDDPERRLMEFFDVCPFVFSTPLMRTAVDVHDAQYVPRIDGPGIATNLYRTVYSKSLLFVQVHLATEVKLPPQDPDGFMFMWRDAESLPKSKIPVFVRAVWPNNQRMSGGGRLVRRFNSTFGTEFAEDVPIDVCMAVWSLMTWSRNRSELMGVTGMRARLAALDESARRGEQTALLYPGTREIPNPQYTIDERVGMHIQYLAHLGDPEARDRVTELWQRGSAAIRMGCAKAALALDEPALFRQIVSSEPQGRMQTYMTKLVRKRKTRDLTDAVPRLLDEQYEFAAPLWTKRSEGSRRFVEGGEGGILPS